MDTKYTITLTVSDHFGYNEESAHTNKFQKRLDRSAEIYAKQEFEAMVSKLKSCDIEVVTIASKKDKITKDAVFPNNWFSVHQKEDGKKLLVIYPMLNKNRQAEKQTNVVAEIVKPDVVLDFSCFERERRAMEGTGSMVLDRINKIAYISISPRSEIKLAKEICREIGYNPVFFESFDTNNEKIYHTNVMMSVGKDFSVVCLECIHNKKQRYKVRSVLSHYHKEIIEISEKQVQAMAGNILEVKDTNNNPKIIMSKTAYKSFNSRQIKALEKHGEIVTVDISNIESIGGGSARCMLAEIF